MRISYWSSTCSLPFWSEVHLALECAAILEAQGIGADVVSLVCAELFDEQDADYRADVFPTDCLKVSIAAGKTFGLERYTDTEGLRPAERRVGKECASTCRSRW